MGEAKNAKRFYLTLDFEEDLGSAAPSATFYSHKGTPRFIERVLAHDWKITIFVTGQILAEQPELIEPYRAHPDRFSFGLHAYDHRDVFNREAQLSNVERGLKAYADFFGRPPLIYRAPNGMLLRGQLLRLVDNGVLAGSNFFPCWFPGRFDYSHVPRTPFRVEGTDFIEMPFSVTRLPRIPIALSYHQLFGRTLLTQLASFDRPSSIVFDFHLHDLFPETWYNTIPISRGMKMAYYQASRPGRAIELFERLTADYAGKGYVFADLHDYLHELRSGSIDEVSLARLYP